MASTMVSTQKRKQLPANDQIACFEQQNSNFSKKGGGWLNIANHNSLLNPGNRF